MHHSDDRGDVRPKTELPQNGISRRASLVTMAGGAASLLAGALGVAVGPRWSRGFSSQITGFHVCEWTSPTGAMRKYVRFVPYHPDPSHLFPTILFLNGFGENGNDGRMPLAENFGTAVWERKQHFPFVVVAAQCSEGAGWHSEGSSALAMLNETARELPIDADRIYLTGVSTGGLATWELVAQNSDRFAAVVPVASPGLASGNRGLCELLAKANLPIWAFYNRFDDVPGVVPFNQQMQRDLLELGRSPLFTDFPDQYHNCWDRAYGTPALYTWLLSQRISQRNRRATRFSLLTQDQAAAFLRRGAGAVWNAAGDHGLTCVPTRPDSECYLLSTSACREIEIHCEIYLERGVTSGIVPSAAVRPDGRVDGWKLVLSRPESGAAGIVSLDGRHWLATCDPIAQTQLLSNAWSDVRLRVSDRRLLVMINGYLAIDRVVNQDLLGPGRFGFACSAARPAAVGQWRRVRTIVQA
jgi:dienelactone hydrolase